MSVVLGTRNHVRIVLENDVVLEYLVHNFPLHVPPPQAQSKGFLIIPLALKFKSILIFRPTTNICLRTLLRIYDVSNQYIGIHARFSILDLKQQHR